MTRALLVSLLILAPLLLPVAQAGAPDETCDDTGLLVCANVAEEIKIQCSTTEGGARCIVLREIEFLVGSPAGLPGGADATSAGSVRVCFGTNPCIERDLDLAILDCDFGAQEACFVHATLLPFSIDVQLAAGECLVVEVTNASIVTAGVPFRGASALVEATATTSTTVERTVCV